MSTVKRKVYLPTSGRVGIRVDTPNNKVEFFEPENPTIGKSEIKIFTDSEFFKTEYSKNLTDDVDFKRVDVELIETTNELSLRENSNEYVTQDGVAPSLIESETDRVMEINFNKELMEEYRRLIFPFLTLEVRRQNDLLYKNTLSDIDKEKLEFVQKGLDTMEVKLGVESMISNYVDLSEVKADFKHGASGVAKRNELEDKLYMYSNNSFVSVNPDKANGVIEYLLDVKFFGNILTSKGNIKG
jgi:hypothetical protein